MMAGTYSENGIAECAELAPITWREPILNNSSRLVVIVREAFKTPAGHTLLAGIIVLVMMLLPLP